MAEEIWKPVLGFEGIYEVSSMGRIKSVQRTDCRGQLRKSFIRKPRLWLGRFRVALAKNRKVTHKSVSVLVLEAFVGPRPDGHVCCHFNDIATDDRLENLRWDTHSANRRDCVRNGTFSYNFTHSSGEGHYKSLLTQKDVDRIREAKLFGARSKDLASVYDIDVTCINAIFRGKSWRNSYTPVVARCG